MTLKDAVLDLAERMETYSRRVAGQGEQYILIRSWANELRTMLKTAEGRELPEKFVTNKEDVGTTPRVWAELPEAGSCGGLLVKLSGGKSDGEYAAVASKVKQGVKLWYSGEVYQLGEDMVLHHCEAETKAAFDVK